MGNKRIARLAREGFLDKPLFEGFTDIRKKPQIRLQPILTSLFAMPFFSLASFRQMTGRHERNATRDCRKRSVPCAAGRLGPRWFTKRPAIGRHSSIPWHSWRMIL
jgi:hypothetical protein